MSLVSKNYKRPRRVCQSYLLSLVVRILEFQVEFAEQ